MTDRYLERVCSVVSGTLQVPLQSVTIESSADTISSWDSLNHLNLILALEQDFGIRLRPEESDTMTSVRRICEVLGARGNR